MKQFLENLRSLTWSINSLNFEGYKLHFSVHDIHSRKYLKGESLKSNPKYFYIIQFKMINIKMPGLLNSHSFKFTGQNPAGFSHVIMNATFPVCQRLYPKYISRSVSLDNISFFIYPPYLTQNLVL